MSTSVKPIAKSRFSSAARFTAFALSIFATPYRFMERLPPAWITRNQAPSRSSHRTLAFAFRAIGLPPSAALQLLRHDSAHQLRDRDSTLGRLRLERL